VQDGFKKVFALLRKQKLKGPKVAAGGKTMRLGERGRGEGLKKKRVDGHELKHHGGGWV